MSTKNLGTVQAIHIGSSPPSNTFMLWYNNGINTYTRYKHYYFDILTSTWKIVAPDVSISTTLLNGTVTYINVGSKTLHSLIQIKFKIIRNSAIATGFLEIINDGSSVQVSEPNGRTVYGDNNEVGEDAIAINVGYSGTNIRLIITCSNTGSDASINLFEIKQVV
jgi:hypothetical protein